jgi:hypothetical protein
MSRRLGSDTSNPGSRLMPSTPSSELPWSARVGIAATTVELFGGPSGSCILTKPWESYPCVGPISVQYTLPSAATSTAIGPLTLSTRIVRLKFFQTVPEQSVLPPWPATQRTPPTMCFTSRLSASV